MGFDFHPRTRKLYFADNGADSIGGVMTANRPDDKLGYAPRKGEWHEQCGAGGGQLPCGEGQLPGRARQLAWRPHVNGSLAGWESLALLAPLD